MDDFVLGLILAEENRRLSSGQQGTEASGTPREMEQQTYTYEDTDVVYDTVFDTPPQYVQENIDGGGGTITQFALYSQSDNYEVLVEIDGTEFVFDTFGNLQARSTMMSKVNARERDGGYFFSVEDLEYNDSALFRVFPGEKITFDHVRLSADVWRPVGVR